MTGNAGTATGVRHEAARDVRTRFWGWTLRTLRAYAVSRSGAGMLVTGGFSLVVIAGVGSLMTDYAWREAQWEEIREAARAAVMATGKLLGDRTAESEQEAKERIAEFMEGLVGDLEVEPENVNIGLDGGVTTVSIAGLYPFDRLWGSDGEPEDVSDTVRVQFEGGPREIAFVVDSSGSMQNNKLDDGYSAINGLVRGVDIVAQMMRQMERRDEQLYGAIVPFGQSVRVADLCRDPDNYSYVPMHLAMLGKEHHTCTTDETEPKQRYVRMLAGAEDTLAQSLLNARQARDAGTGGHWVDAYHHYGAGTDMGPLRRLYLPDSLLNQGDWNFQKDLAIDVSAQVPWLGTWRTSGNDFWNGCVMARWGAYWHPDARPAHWDPAEPANWPARAPVAAWGPTIGALPANTPLHLSDAPPDASDPHTLFTAFSHPDARNRQHRGLRA